MSYLYSPPMWRNPSMMGWALRASVNTCTLVYRQNGVWYNQEIAGMDEPVIANVDVDSQSGMKLFFTHPVVVPDWLHDELAALTQADSSWIPATLTPL